MPQIQTYDDHIAAQGGIAAQARPDDFGAQIGAATQRFGGAVQDAGEAVHQYNTTQDVTNVHVNMAKARSEWTKTLHDRTNEAQPGDETFAPTLMKDMDAYFQKFGESVQTPRGKQLYATMSASMSSEFGVRAIGVQGELAAKDAVNKYTTLATAYGSTAYQDPTQMEVAISSGKAAIDDPSGMFGKVPQPAREKFKQQLENDVKYAAANGFIEKGGSAELLKSIAPDLIQQFKPAENLVKSATAPGAKANISAKTMQWAPQVQAEAAKKGLNANILLAQIQQESGGNPNAVGPQTRFGTAKGLTQFIDATAADYGVDVKDPNSAIKGQAAMMGDMLKKYGGDYSKALAAYNWGPGNLDKSLQRWGADWRNHLPAETSNYVEKIMYASGSVSMNPSLSTATPDTAVPVAEAPVAQRAPVESKLPFMNGLTWEQQNHLVNKSVQLENMKMGMAHKAREQADYELRKQQEAVSGQYINRIIDPANNGGPPSDQEIAANPVLTAQQKQHFADYKIRRQHELTSASENKANPVEVRRLMMQIHAVDGDPTKTYSFDPVMQSYSMGNLSTPEMKMLRTEVEQMRDGNGNSFGKQAQQAREVVWTTFTRSIEGQINPAKAASAAYSFTRDLDQKITALRKEGKDPTVLLDPSSREYMLKPERLNGYGMTVNYGAATQANAQTSQTLADQAAKAAQAEKTALPTHNDYDKIKKGDSYTDPKGNVRVKG
jgi:soluble lytic murein transglycosylase-like protein